MKNRFFNRIMSFGVALLIISLSMVATVSADEKALSPADKSNMTGYTDVPENAWYYDTVCWAITNNLLGNPHSQNNFEPYTTVSRGMFCELLMDFSYDIGKDILKSGCSPFFDVNSSAWYGMSVSWAYEKNLVNGCNGTTFLPETEITREQAATILCRYMTGYLGIDISTASLSYRDTADISQWADEAVRKLSGAGIFIGCDGNFLPHNDITRAELATLYYRMYQFYLSNK